MKFEEIRKKVELLCLPFGKYVLIGSTPMAAYGIREAKDIDLVVLPELYEKLKTDGWKEELQESGRKVLTKNGIEAGTDWNCKSYHPSVSRLIVSADVIDGIPVTKLEEVLAWKKACGREKDLKDVKLIEDKLARQSPA